MDFLDHCTRHPKHVGACEECYRIRLKSLKELAEKKYGKVGEQKPKPPVKDLPMPDAPTTPAPDITEKRHRGNKASRMANPDRAKKQADCDNIYAKFVEAGWGGLIPEEAYLPCGLDDSSGSARCSDLKIRMKKIVGTGKYRRNRKGNRAEVMVADIYTKTASPTPAGILEHGEDL